MAKPVIKNACVVFYAKKMACFSHATLYLGLTLPFLASFDCIPNARALYFSRLNVFNPPKYLRSAAHAHGASIQKKKQQKKGR